VGISGRERAKIIFFLNPTVVFCDCFLLFLSPSRSADPGLCLRVQPQGRVLVQLGLPDPRTGVFKEVRPAFYHTTFLLNSFPPTILSSRNPLQSSLDDDGIDKDALAGGDDGAFLTLDDMEGQSIQHQTKPNTIACILSFLCLLSLPFSLSFSSLIQNPRTLTLWKMTGATGTGHLFSPGPRSPLCHSWKRPCPQSTHLLESLLLLEIERDHRPFVSSFVSVPFAAMWI